MPACQSSVDLSCGLPYSRVGCTPQHLDRIPKLVAALEQRRPVPIESVDASTKVGLMSRN
jgi:hypothetical protein